MFVYSQIRRDIDRPEIARGHPRPGVLVVLPIDLIVNLVDNRSSQCGEFSYIHTRKVGNMYICMCIYV